MSQYTSQSQSHAALCKIQAETKMTAKMYMAEKCPYFEPSSAQLGTLSYFRELKQLSGG